MTTLKDLESTTPATASWSDADPERPPSPKSSRKGDAPSGKLVTGAGEEGKAAEPFKKEDSSFKFFLVSLRHFRCPGHSHADISNALSEYFRIMTKRGGSSTPLHSSA